MPDSRNIFPFFKLPRELRDEIYDLATIKKRRVKRSVLSSDGGECSLRLYVLDGPIRSLLSVSWQFQYEHLERMSKSTSIGLEDFSVCEYTHPTIPAALSGYPLSQVSFLIFGPTCPTIHAQGLEAVQYKVSSTGIRIKLYVKDEDDDTTSADVADLANRLLDCQKVSSMTAFTWSCSGDAEADNPPLRKQEIDTILEYEDKRVGAWTREGGWSWDPTYKV